MIRLLCLKRAKVLKCSNQINSFIPNKWLIRWILSTAPLPVCCETHLAKVLCCIWTHFISVLRITLTPRWPVMFRFRLHVSNWSRVRGSMATHVSKPSLNWSQLFSLAMYYHFVWFSKYTGWHQGIENGLMRYQGSDIVFRVAAMPCDKVIQSCRIQRSIS